MPSRENNRSGITGKSQKGEQIVNYTEEQARDYFERLRWPNGPVCPHCGTENQATRLQGKSARPGTFQCNSCREQFTVTVKSVMEDSHLPLATWAKAFHFMCASKKGISALQLQRMLGLGSYRTAWFLAHRIREAMKCEPVAGMLKGTVEVDETYVGGQLKNCHKGMNRLVNKTPIVALVERDGKSKAFAVKKIDGRILRSLIRNNIDRSQSTLMTDEHVGYIRAGNKFKGGHQTVSHGYGEYTNGDAHTNTVESWNALFKRGFVGSFHQLSEKHMQRYADEFAFRWSGRKLKDTERRDAAVKGAAGKRLMYREPLKEQLPPTDGDGQQLPPFPQ